MKQNLFALFDIPVTRTAKTSQVNIEAVGLDFLWLKIDNEDVRLKKEDNGTLSLSCTCEWCGKKGIAKQQLCRRQLRALFFLLQRNGRISEIEVKKE